MNKQINTLWKRVEAVISAIENKEEVTYAGLLIQRSTFKHSVFCHTDYYRVTDLVSGRTVLELHGQQEKLEICRYQKEDFFWKAFMQATVQFKGLENSLGLSFRR